MIGFSNLGEVNDEIAHLTDCEGKGPTIATHILSFMMRGVFNSKEHTVAHYPTTGVTGEQLYSIVWGVIKALELAEFKVQ